MFNCKIVQSQPLLDRSLANPGDAGFLGLANRRIGVAIGCALIFGASPVYSQTLTDLFKSVTEVIPSNPFDLDGSAFNKLVDGGEMEKAESFFISKYASYFDKKFNADKREVTPQLKKLGRWAFERSYQSGHLKALAQLKGISDLSSNANDAWQGASDAIASAQKLAFEINSNDLLQTSKVGPEATDAISAEVGRIYDVAARDRAKALSSTFDDVLRTGLPNAPYPRTPFTGDDYKKSSEFQKKVIAALSAETPEGRENLATKLVGVTAVATTQSLARAQDLKRRKDGLGSAPYPLNKLAEIRSLVKEYGVESGLESAVKIGFIDLTASSFKNRNVFDFELTFEKDYGLAFEDANELFIGKNSVAGFDYIFVTDLSAAKILREFKNKKEIQSTVQTGTRQEQNPEYVGALSAYQTSMSRMQAAKLEAANNSSKPCYGSALSCALLGVANGLSSAGAENEFKKSSEVLARTPQLVSKPVFSKYNYQLVDANVTKIARVDYFVIDVNQKKIYSSYFELKDNEKFTVSYNVEDEDPNKSSILRNSQSEADVTAWEKRPVSVSLSSLFDPENIRINDFKKFTTAEAFLKPLTTREYANAAPTYVGKSAAKSEVKDSSTRGESGAIADERFDSILILRTPKAIGTGFYVTPDLILTAAHVVDGSSLVQMTFYDGTKSFGKVVDADVRLDLALIKAQTVGKPLKLHTGPIRLGETAEAIGHPKGYEFTITRGVVSAIRKQASAMLKSGAPIEFVQTDTPISPGNSGGPLFIKDVVIGVNDWVRVDKASQNLNFSVSYNEIREYLNRFEGAKK